MSNQLEDEKNKGLEEFGVKKDSNEPEYIFDPETGEPNDDI